MDQTRTLWPGFVLLKSISASCLFLLISTALCQDLKKTEYEVYAVQYATLPAFPVRALVADADSSRRIDIAMMVWILRGTGGRVVLVDAGFHRDHYIKRWNPQNFLLPSKAIEKLGISPEDVTDLMITHMHWDHAGSVDLFPKARVWIERDEFEYYTMGEGKSGNNDVDREDAALLTSLKDQGRLMLVEGDAKEILPGIIVYTGGRHTYASQFVGVRTKGGRTVILASDNMYLYENLERHAPIAQTFDAVSNLKAQDRMKQLASEIRLIVPGHDSEVFRRFSIPGNGIARIE